MLRSLCLLADSEALTVNLTDGSGVYDASYKLKEVERSAGVADSDYDLPREQVF